MMRNKLFTGSLLLLLCFTTRAEQPEPELTFSPLGGELNLVRGQPWLFELSATVPYDFTGDTPAIRITGTNTSWAEAVEIQVVSGSNPVAWPFLLATSPELSIELDAQTSGLLHFYISPEQTAALSAGDFVLHAEIPASAFGASDASAEAAQSVPVHVTVHDAPATPPEENAEHHRAFAAYYFMLNNLPAAALEINAWVAAQPENPQARYFLAALLRKQGQPADAWNAIQSAMQLLDLDSESEPPAQYLAKGRELLAEMVLLQLTILVRDGLLTLSWADIPSALWRVESSSDLLNWTAEAHDPKHEGDSWLWQTNRSSINRFFRLVR